MEETKLPETLTGESIPKLQKSDIESLRKGVRPSGMNFDTYKMLTKALKDLEKQYLKGQYVFVSQTYDNKKLGNKGLTYKKEK